MSTMEFLTGHSESSRPGPVKFRASEILRLWSGKDKHHHDLLNKLRRTGGGHERYKVAAILPSQELSEEDYEALEDSDVLVIEVPQDLETSSESEIAAFLTAELTAGATATAKRMAAIGTTDPAVAALSEDELQLSDEEEAELLEFVNDPANQLGGHF